MSNSIKQNMDLGVDAIGTRKVFYGIIAALALAIAGTQYMLSGYLLEVLYVLFMYMALSTIWNMFSGFSGYIMFGATLFFGVGAYATGGLLVHVGMPWYVGVLLGAIVTAIIAAPLGYILLRISGIYFAISTFLLMEGLREGLFWEAEFTNYFGGSAGLVLPSSIPASESTLVFGLLLLVTLAVTYEVATSTFGLRLLAIREDEEALKTLGVNPIRYKLSAFVIMALLAGAIGGVYATSLGFLYPDTPFKLNIVVTIILAAILGGMGTVWGSALAMIILVVLEEALWLEYPNLFLILFGTVLIASILIVPQGIINRLKKLGVLPHTRGV